LKAWIQAHPRWTIALCSLLWALCYPPFPLGWLSFVVLFPAFLATPRLRPRQAFAAWFVGGLAYNTVMYWWIYNVIKVGPAFIIGGGLVLLVLFLSLFNGLIGLGFRYAQKHPLLLITFPVAFAGLEVARAVGEMSFPWNDFGYALGHTLTLIQGASLFGTYGLSALLVLANLFLFIAFQKVSQNSEGDRRKRPPFPVIRLIWLLGWLLVPLALGTYGRCVLRQNDAGAPSMKISLVQPSIPQTKKWSEEYFGEVVAKTFRTMDGPRGDRSPVEGSDLIVLAETAIPDFLRSRPELIDTFFTRAAQLHAPILMGALDFVPDRKPWRDYIFYNSAFLFPPKQNGVLQQYSKLRLVPFSEKLPFQNVFPILNYVHLGEGDFSPGTGYQVWGDNLRFAPSICYEIIYPSFAREAKRAGAQFLVNITNDGWFGRSNAPYQHANIARFRAVETGMPIARCANSGVSVFYDAWGRDLGHTELMDSTVLQRRLPVPSRSTFYARHGDGVDALLLAFLGAWILGLLGVLLYFRPVALTPRA
jgi:apolipoprotein N-acyltransferase